MRLEIFPALGTLNIEDSQQCNVVLYLHGWACRKIYTDICIHIYIYIYIYIHIHIIESGFVYLAFFYVYVCVHTCVYVCMCAYAYVYIYICTHTHICLLHRLFFFKPGAFIELWRPWHTPELGDGVRLLRDGGIVERPLGAQWPGIHLFPRHQRTGGPPGPVESAGCWT